MHVVPAVMCVWCSTLSMLSVYVYFTVLLKCSALLRVYRVVSCKF